MVIDPQVCIVQSEDVDRNVSSITIDTLIV